MITNKCRPNSSGRSFDDRTLEREPVGETGQQVVAGLAFDPLVQHASTKARRELFGEVLQPDDVVVPEPLAHTGASGHDEQADDSGTVTDRGDHHLGHLRTRRPDRIEEDAGHQHRSLRLDHRLPALVLDDAGQLHADAAVNLPDRRLAVLEEHDRRSIRAKQHRRLGDGGPHDVVRIE